MHCKYYNTHKLSEDKFLEPKEVRIVGEVRMCSHFPERKETPTAVNMNEVLHHIGDRGRGRGRHTPGASLSRSSGADSAAGPLGALQHTAPCVQRRPRDGGAHDRNVQLHGSGSHWHAPLPASRSPGQSGARWSAPAVFPMSSQQHHLYAAQSMREILPLNTPYFYENLSLSRLGSSDLIFICKHSII